MLCESIRRLGRKCSPIQSVAPFYSTAERYGIHSVRFVRGKKSAIAANMCIRATLCVALVLAAACVVNCQEVSSRLIVESFETFPTGTRTVRSVSSAKLYESPGCKLP